jgi:tryptophanyl-tRNA synthetase
MSKPVILTGIRANNDLHIGNYFGALLPMVDMARNKSNEYDVNLMLADLHSFITPIDHSQLQNNIRQTLRNYAAAGLPLDKDSVRPFRQSYVPAHSELTWILDCFVGMGELGRMTQFKDKASKLSDDRINVGLFNYPVLMACDVLLYGAEYVPVGEDQTQHLEFMRDIAERMNTRFGNLFVVPRPVKEQHELFGKDQGLRIKDLIDPTKKMSKSDESGRGIIFLGDNPDAAAKKIMSATTDSVGMIHLDFDKQPGVSNLLQILALLRGQSLNDVAKEYDGRTSYGELKADVAERVKEFLTTFQTKLADVDEDELYTKLEASEATMREIANKTLLRVQHAVGLRRKITAKEADAHTYRKLLDEVGIANEIVTHSSTRHIDKVIEELGITLADTLPTLVANADGRFIALIARGGRKINFEKVKAQLHVHELRMATPEEFIKQTGLPVGAARVYLPNMETIIDPSVFEQEYLTGGSGRFDCSIRYKTADLKKIPGVKVVDLAE